MNNKIEKFQGIAKEWFALGGELRKECVKFLTKTLKANDNRIEWDDAELVCSVCVTYDGGNHPEYASNAFSTVTAVNLKDNGDITLETEDTPEYCLENVSTAEVYDLCDFIDAMLG